MKNMLKFFAVAFFAIMLSFFGLTFVGTSAHAEELQIPTIETNDVSEKIEKYLTEFAIFNNRIPGSEGEREAGEYILNTLSAIPNIVPAKCKGLKDEDGIQNFTFSSIVDGKNHTSQNIILSYVSKQDNKKKIILGCSYDGLAINNDGEVVGSEAINGSAGSVAVLMALAEYLSNVELDFNIDFIFFGAGISDNAGATYYTNGVSKEDGENILLMMNMENIAVGRDLYFYVDEVKTELSNLAEELSVSKNLRAELVDVSHLSKTMLSDTSDLGLTYSHIANSSNNEKFMKLGILSMNVFAGDYSSGLVFGKSEYAGKDVVVNTQNDNIDYISKTIGEREVADNLLKTFNFVSELISDSSFVSSCEKSVSKISTFYSIFGNEKLAIYLTIIALFISLIIAFLVHYNLSVKAYKASVDSQFASSVISISENFSNSGANMEVSKVISQVIANDIKKDKRIKRKKKDDKK